jgi:hypothetical protein
MDALDYSISDKSTREPLFGRLGVGCWLLLVTTVVVVVSVDGDTANPPGYRLGECAIIASSGLGFACGAIAILRKESRTPLAWFSFFLGLIWWIIVIMARISLA